MKKILLGMLLLLGYSQSVDAQERKLRVYTLEECNGDTLLFLQKNYDERENWLLYSDGFSLDSLLDMAEKAGLVFHSYFWQALGDRTDLTFFVETVDEAKKKAEGNRLCFRLRVEAGIKWEDREAIRSTVERRLYPIDRKFKRMIKKMLVYDVTGTPMWMDSPKSYDL